MQVENDYDKEIYNGGLGVVRSIDPETSEMVIKFDERAVTYGFGELDEIVLAYATTIGSVSVPDEFSLNVPIENSLIGV